MNYEKLYRLFRVHKKMERFMLNAMSGGDINLATMFATEGYFWVNEMIKPIIIENSEELIDVNI